MANRAIWGMRKRHEWLATPLKAKKMKRSGRVRADAHGMGALAPPVRRIAVLAFPDVQILDVVGPLEVFGRTARFLIEKGLRARSTYAIEVVALTAGPVFSSSGIALVADRGF